MDAFLAALGASGVAVFLRSSEYVYPLVNAAHILGFALLVGTIAALDARILGYARTIPLADAARLLLPFTVGGLDPRHRRRRGAVHRQAGGICGQPGVPREARADRPRRGERAVAPLPADVAVALAGGAVSPGLRVSAVLSLCLWMAVLVAGRLIAFFGY